MDELVEKIARAIEKGEKRWIGIDPGSPAFCRNAAQAALAAIRETHAIVPKVATPEMCKAFFDNAMRTSVSENGGWHGYAQKQLTAMIEAASPQSPPTGDRR